MSRRSAEVFSERAAIVGKLHAPWASAKGMSTVGMGARAVLSMRFVQSMIHCGVNMACAFEDVLQSISAYTWMRTPPGEQ